jgi:hypothetical protein
MIYLLNGTRLNFGFRSSYVTCSNYSYGYYQNNGMLSFAVMDLAFKIIKQQKRKSTIILKKRKPIIHLLNYVDLINLDFHYSTFDIRFFLKNKYRTQLIRNLYLYRYYKDCLAVIERGDSCIIRFEPDYADRIQPKNSNLAAMLMHILKEIDIIDARMMNGDGIIFYCVFLM